jgi:hypothetical protein
MKKCLLISDTDDQVPEDLYLERFKNSSSFSTINEPVSPYT